MSTTANTPTGKLEILPQTDPDSAPGSRRWRTAALNALPNLVVFALLGSVFYLGHRTGWKMPRASIWFGGAESSANGDWCVAHLVPESQCVECNAGLLPRQKEFGFCRRHGVAECVIDHPELAEISKDPQLPRYDTARAIGLIDRPENNSRNMLHKQLIQFASAESALKAGIDVDVVQERKMVEFLSANGQLIFDPTRVAHLSSRVSGNIARVFKRLGDDVRAGEVLALVDATQVGQAKSQLIQAVVRLQLRKTTVERLREPTNKGAIPAKLLIEAESALQEADIALLTASQTLANLGLDVSDKITSQGAAQIAENLRFLGIPETIAASLSQGTQSANLLPIVAPLEGTVIECDVVVGEVVDNTKSLFTVANPRELWLFLNMRQEDARYVALNLPVLFRTDDGRQEATGRVYWMSPSVDEKTRTLRVRVTLDNQTGRLRDKTFGTGRIILREEPYAVVVPREAVQSTSDAQFVFVRDKDYLKVDSPKVFHVRQVRVGARDEDHVELLAGVLPGEVVATRGSAALLAQLLRSSLGAGCGCHEH